MTSFGGVAYGGILDNKNGVLTNAISAFIRRDRRTSSLAKSTPGREPLPECNCAITLILGLELSELRLRMDRRQPHTVREDYG